MQCGDYCMECVPHAKVPIVKCVDVPTSTNCDIVPDNDSGTKKKTLDHAALKAKASRCSRTRAELRRSRTF